MGFPRFKNQSIEVLSQAASEESMVLEVAKKQQKRALRPHQRRKSEISLLTHMIAHID